MQGETLQEEQQEKTAEKKESFAKYTAKDSVFSTLFRVQHSRIFPRPSPVREVETRQSLPHILGGEVGGLEGLGSMVTRPGRTRGYYFHVYKVAAAASGPKPSVHSLEGCGDVHLN